MNNIKHTKKINNNDKTVINSNLKRILIILSIVSMKANIQSFLDMKEKKYEK